MKKRVLCGLCAAVLVIAGCDAVKGLLGEDDGSSGSGGGSGGSSSGGVSVAFQEIDVAGGGTTTLVTLVFDRDIPGLSEGDVTITDAGDTGAVAGVLSPTEAAGAYTLAVSGVKETGPIAISAGKSGYTFSPATQTAVVNFDEASNKVTFVGAIANVTANTQTTTALTLAFNATFPLQPGDITLWPGSTGAAMGGLAPSGDGAFSLAVPGVAAEGEVFVTVVKDGYAVRPATVRVPVHYPGPLAGGGGTSFYVAKGDPVNPGNPSVKAKFGVTQTGKAGVEAAFKELSAFIQKGGLANQPGVIKPGDYIDLEGGLQVAAYGAGGGGFSSGSVDWNGDIAGGHGKLSRLIVVGINSFDAKNGNSTPHVVFQFQHTPVKRQMNVKDISEGGYAASDMRKYLSGPFLAGLIDAGVPDEVLWPPARMVSIRDKTTEDNNDMPPAEIQDKLWLPTAWEMTGSATKNVLDETAANQARLEYYNDDPSRVKYDTSGAKQPYWLASTTLKSFNGFVSIKTDGTVRADSSAVTSDVALGVAPAFCVQGWIQQ